MAHTIVLLKRILFCLFCLTSLVASAQQFGGFPPSVKWKQIDSDTARIIYARGAAGDAQRVAAIIHTMAATSNPLGKSLQKINVVLHNKTTLANGYVGLAPYRSEYYLVPGGNIFDFGNLPWQEQLAIHEYRHVQQYNNFNRGGSKLLSFVLGEEGRALANAFAIPDWFFEGDAVFAETVLTTGGRGRTPYFLKGFNSLWKEGRNYNWMKLRNGSLKDFVPNHYPLGFLLVNYGYLKYGPDFWRRVTADASAFKGGLYPFQKAVARTAGVSFATFRNEAFRRYSHEVSRRRDNQKTRATVTNAYHPQLIGKDSLLYTKDSYKRIPQFVIRTNAGEQLVGIRRITSEDWFSYREGTIAYTAYTASPRWGLVDYSNIILLDIKSRKDKIITRQGRYFSPDIAPGGGSIIAVSITDSLTSELHLLDREGSIIKKIAAAPNALFVQPRFIDTNNIAVGFRSSDALLSWQQINLVTGAVAELIPPNTATIGYPFVHEGKLYFTSSASGSDDLYSLGLKDKKLVQLSTGGTGRYFPAAAGDSLYWSDFTSNGFLPRSAALRTMTASASTLQFTFAQVPPFELAATEKPLAVLQPINAARFAAPYQKGRRLLQFHSWRPFYEAPEYSFSAYSNNILNTLSNEVFYRYNENEQSHTLGLSAAYGGFFPVLSGGVEHTFNRHIKSATRTLTVKSSEARIGYSIPLNFTSGKTFRFLNWGSNLVYNSLEPTGSSKTLIRSSITGYLHHFLTWSEALPKARKHIFPKFAYVLSGAYRHRMDGSEGYQSAAAGQLYLPGFFATHSWAATAGFQRTDTGNVIFSNRFVSSRGYNDRFFSRMYKATVNYHFPLLYPDRGMANIVYLLRVRSTIFYDYTRQFRKAAAIAGYQRSAGTEILFDTKWWNQLPVSFGLRYSRLFDNKEAGIRNPNVFELIVPINLIPQ